MPTATESQTPVTAGELRAVLRKLHRKLREQTPRGGFTPSQVAVMTRLLSDGPSTLTALARAEGMRPQSMSAIVTALEAVDYIRGTPDPTDGRQTILGATSRARAAATQVQASKDDWLVAAIRSRLSAAEQANLARSIPLLARLAEPQPESRQK